jgi:hypothetical protein
MLTGPGLIKVEVAKMSDAIVQAVKSLPFVVTVVQTGDSLSIDVSTREDVRAQVSQAIANAGGIIINMNVKASNLEDVFIQLITKDHGGKTQ